MSLTRISSLLLPWFLCLSFLPSCVAVTTDPTPTPSIATPVSAVPIQSAIINNNNNNNNSTTLLFQGSSPGGSLHSCSCPALVPHCNESLANLLCSCRGIPSSALPPAGLGELGGLVTVWLWDVELLHDLLNGSLVSHLQLVSCGRTALSTQYLALLGLRSLRIHSSIPGALYPHQEVSLSTPDARALSVSSEEEEEKEEEGAAGRDLPSAPPLRLTFLDVALLNGRSALKAYSVTGRSASSLAAQFPHLPLALLLHSPATTSPGEGGTVSHDQVGDPGSEYVLTFVY